MRFGVRRWITVLSCLVLTSAPLLAGGEGENTAAESSETMELATGAVEKNWGWATLADYERETGNRITSFNEAPILAALVASGDLPPVEDRLPDEPLVDEPFEQVGTYGGTLRLGMVSGTTYYPATIYQVDFTLGLNRVGEEIVPNIAKGFEFSPDNTTMTLSLREGMKWSDGAPFDANDFLFWYESVLLNKDLTPVARSWLRPAGQLVEVEKIDDYTLTFSFAVPYRTILFYIGSAGFSGGQGVGTGGIFSPEHYMKQFHIDHNPQANDLAKQEGFDNWTQLFKARDRADIIQQAVGTPVTQPWMIKSVLPEGAVYERNPYFYKIDTAGNQLPYIDTVRASHFTDHEAMILATVTGNYDYMDWGTKFEDVPVLVENEEKGNYKTFMTKDLWGNHSAYYFNQNYEDDPELGELLRNKTFRQALSIAINRGEVNSIIASGLGIPRQATMNPDLPFYEEQWGTAWAQYDPDEANRMLDGIGLDKRDSDGFRLRPDGQPLSLQINHPLASGSRIAADEMVRSYWNAVGVRTQVKPMDRAFLVQAARANQAQVNSWIFSGSSLPSVLKGGTNYLRGNLWGYGYQQWWNTKDSAQPKGMEPPDEVKRMFTLMDEIPALVGDEKIVAIREAFDIWADNVYGTGVFGLIPKPAVVHKNIGNVNTDTITDISDVGTGWFNRQYQFFWKQ